MTAREVPSPGFDSRCTAPAGTRRKSPGPASATTAPPGPDSSRIRPETTYSVVSWSPWWCQPETAPASVRSEEHTSELQSQFHLVCRLLLEKKKKQQRLDEQSYKDVT